MKDLMMESTNPIKAIYEQRAKNLKALIEVNYKNINDFCKKNGLDYGGVYRYIHGHMNIGKIAVKKFEKIFELLPGSLDKVSAVSSGMHQISIYPTDSTYSGIIEILSQQAISTAYMNLSEIKKLNLDKQKQIGIKYCNDSMIPHIKNGWYILVNTEDQTIKDGEDYAVLYNNHFLIRKIFFNPESNDSLTLKANNPEFNNFTVGKSEIVIIGRPVYILLGKF